MQIGRMSALFIVFCTALVLVGLFLLPWVGFETTSHIAERVTAFQQETSIQEILQRVPALRDAFGIQPGFVPGKIETLFSDPEQQRLAALAQHHSQLTGWMMWRSVPQLGRGLSWGILLTAGCALLILLTTLASVLFKNVALIKSMLLISFIGVLLSLLLLLVYLPRVDTFGEYDDLSLVFLCFLLGTETRAGIYVALAGLGLAAVGLSIMFFTTADTRRSDDESYGLAV